MANRQVGWELVDDGQWQIYKFQRRTSGMGTEAEHIPWCPYTAAAALISGSTAETKSLTVNL